MGSATSYFRTTVRPQCFTLKSQGNDAQGQAGAGGEPIKHADYISTAAAGVNHSLAVTTKGEVFAWGCNLYGQLGNGGINPENNKELITPAVLISFRSQVVIRRVAAGHGHSAALSEAGVVFTWGLGSDGQLGYQMLQEDSYVIPFMRDRCQLLPRRVELTEAIGDVACGKNFTMLLTVSGGVLMCGSGAWGVLGNGRLSQQFNPEPTTGELEGKRVCSIASGWSHCLASVSGQGVYTWGRPYLDVSEEPAICYPQFILATDSKVLSVACGQNHSAVAIKLLGKRPSVWTWGSNGYGQLGYVSDEGVVQEPREVDLGRSWSVEAVACGWNFTVALGSDGKLKGWGGNKYHQFGERQESATPAFLPAQRVAEVVCGYSHLLLLQTSGINSSMSREVTARGKDDFFPQS